MHGRPSGVAFGVGLGTLGCKNNILIVLFALCVAKSVVFLAWLLHSRLQKTLFSIGCCTLGCKTDVFTMI